MNKRLDKRWATTKFSRQDRDSMMNDVFVRNTATSVKMELCFDGRLRVPLYFAGVRDYVQEGRSELTSTLRMWIVPFEFVAGPLIPYTRLQHTLFLSLGLPSP